VAVIARIKVIWWQVAGDCQCPRAASVTAM
jgi:hypothetical protein